MRIAFIGQKGIPASYGGVERHVEEIATRLAKDSSNQVFVYCRNWYTNNNTKKYHGINLVQTPSIKTKHLDTISHVLFSTFDALFKHYDIIHYQGIGPALLSFVPRLLNPKTKVIVTYHCADYEHQKWGFFAKTMLKLGEIASIYFPHQTITISKNIKEYLDNKFHKNVEYIPNGVSVESNTTTKTEIEKKWQLKPNDYFLTVSRLVRHKGVHYLIEAYQKLYYKNKTNKKLVIVGDSAFTDDYVQELKALAYGNPNIIFTGYQKGLVLEELFKNAYLYVHPSEAEGLPLSLLEAMAYVKPVLISDIKPNLEATQNCGVTFKNKDIKDLQRKLMYSQEHKEELKKLAQKSKKRMLEYYNWDDISKKTFSVYQNTTLYNKRISFVSENSNYNYN